MGNVRVEAGSGKSVFGSRDSDSQYWLALRPFSKRIKIWEGCRYLLRPRKPVYPEAVNTDLSLANRPNLVTERLLLRRPNHRDADAIVGIVGDWEVARRLARVPHPYGLADARFFLEHVVPAEWLWAITLHGSDTLLGAIGLTPEDGAHTAELGYWLSPNYWGSGITTEAAKAVVAFGFESLDLPALTSGYFEDNPASGRVLHKLGFFEVGRAMRPCLAAGGEVAAIRMEMSHPTRG